MLDAIVLTGGKREPLGRSLGDARKPELPVEKVVGYQGLEMVAVLKKKLVELALIFLISAIKKWFSLSTYSVQ